jgi:superfamily II DNA/RNA helicase
VDKLLHLVMEEKQVAENSGHTLPLTIVFVERKARCDEVADALCQEGIYAAALHGGRSQFEREAALRDFRQGKISVLVATVCAPPPPLPPPAWPASALCLRLSNLDAALLNLLYSSMRNACCATTSGRAR